MSAGQSIPPAAGSDTEEASGSLYASAEKIYPRQAHGLYARLRTLSLLGLLGIYYLLPWLQWGGRQAVLLDLPARKFHLFSITLWPQDFIYLAALLIIAGLTLFFVTAIAGRIWCGYACPQTVWTEAFLWIERRVEGNRLQRQKLDARPLDGHKFAIKSVKHLLWIAFAGWTGFTFVGYFTPITELGARLLTFDLGPWETFWVVFYGFATYGNAGWMREQVCKYMCPYARFQGAMFDSDTLIISYDERRGQPRGSRKRGSDPRTQGLGDCIDCTLCVQVCPTGIDIRDGLQYECIACSACIDACDEIMDKMDYPRGLIRYTTENALLGKPAHVLRPRIIIYALILATVTGLLAWSFAARVPLGLDVIRDRNRLYRETSDGLIENVYTLKVLNMDERRHEYRLQARGIEGLEVRMDLPVIHVPAGGVLELPVRLRAEEGALDARSSEVRFILTATDAPELSVTEEARFLGPR